MPSKREVRRRAAMLSEYAGAIVEVASADTAGRAFDRLTALARTLGYSGVAFGTVNNLGNACKAEAFLVDPDTEPFVSSYMERNLGAADPIVAHTFSADRAFSWTGYMRAGLSETATQGLARVVGLAVSRGITATVTLPLRRLGDGRRSAVALHGPRGIAPEEFDRTFEAAHFLANLAVQSAAETLSGAIGAAPSEARLTVSEVAVLRGLALGLRPREIADELGKGESTVRAQILSSQRRLGARTVAEAVARAVRLGFIR